MSHPTGDPTGFRSPIEYDANTGQLEIDCGESRRPHDEIAFWQEYADENRMSLSCIINGVQVAIESGGDPQAVCDFYDSKTSTMNRVRAI